MEELLKKMGMCKVGDKILPAPEYLAEIIQLTKGLDGVKITRDTGKMLLARKFEEIEFISGLFSKRRDDKFKALISKIAERMGIDEEGTEKEEQVSQSDPQTQTGGSGDQAGSLWVGER